jgi:hypothetical protein
VTSSPTPPPQQEQQPQVVTQQVTVKPKRGCSICGCGCIIPAFVVPILTLAFWGTLGVGAVVLTVAAAFGSLHAISALGRALPDASN